jgi:hypothetical protein
MKLEVPGAKTNCGTLRMALVGVSAGLTHLWHRNVGLKVSLSSLHILITINQLARLVLELNSFVSLLPGSLVDGVLYCISTDARANSYTENSHFFVRFFNPTLSVV